MQRLGDEQQDVAGEAEALPTDATAVVVTAAASPPAAEPPLATAVPASATMLPATATAHVAFPCPPTAARPAAFAFPLQRSPALRRSRDAQGSRPPVPVTPPATVAGPSDRQQWHCDEPEFQHMSPTKRARRALSPATATTPSRRPGSFVASMLNGFNDSPSRSISPVMYEAFAISSPLSRPAPRYNRLHEIGSGSFSKVYKISTDEGDFALKVPKNDPPHSRNRRLHEVEKEVLALAAFTTCAFVVRYIRCWEVDRQLYIQMELCDFSCDKAVVKKSAEVTGFAKIEHLGIGQGKFSEPLLLHFLYDCAQGLSALHRTELVHLDVKPANVFYRESIFKLGDLGIAHKVDFVNIQHEEGDARYLAVELLNAHDPALLPRADVFSLAASAYELARGFQLDGGGTHWEELRSHGIRPDTVSHLSSGVIGLLNEMLRRDPASRPDIDTVLDRLQCMPALQDHILHLKAVGAITVAPDTMPPMAVAAVPATVSQSAPTGPVSGGRLGLSITIPAGAPPMMPLPSPRIMSPIPQLNAAQKQGLAEYVETRTRLQVFRRTNSSLSRSQTR